MKAINLTELETNNEQQNDAKCFTLDAMIPYFFSCNNVKKEYTKKVDELNKTIKEKMSNDNITEHIVGDIKASYTISKQPGFDNDLLIQLLKDNLDEELLSQIIKTVEIIDEKALEDALYNKKFNPLIIQQAQTEKEIVRLNIGKVKNKNNGEY